MNQEIIKQAIKHYGVKAQVGIAQEELAELIQALSKFIRGKADYENIAEEIADVEICLAQLKEIFANEDEVEMWKEFKLLRLKGRMSDEILNNNTTTTKKQEEFNANSEYQGKSDVDTEQSIQGVRKGLLDLYKLP